jgi:hypothetical protein
MVGTPVPDTTMLMKATRRTTVSARVVAVVPIISPGVGGTRGQQNGNRRQYQDCFHLLLTPVPLIALLQFIVPSATDFTSRYGKSVAAGNNLRGQGVMPLRLGHSGPAQKECHE